MPTVYFIGIRLGAAVSFFLLYEVYMIMMTWCSIGEDNVTLYSVIVKMVTSILAGVALIAFIVMSKYSIVITFIYPMLSMQVSTGGNMNCILQYVNGIDYIVNKLLILFI